MLRGAHVPLVRSFVLSSKKGKEAIVTPTVDRKRGAYRFAVKTSEGGIGPDEVREGKEGHKGGAGIQLHLLAVGHRCP